MGGRGASAGGIAGGGGGILLNSPTTSLISMRETKRDEVDQTLGVLRDVYDRYGVDVTDAQIAMLPKSAGGVMAYYDIDGNVAIAEGYFDAAKMDAAYDGCVQAGFHPPRGNRTGIEAVTAHEMGHRLTDAAGLSSTGQKWAVDATASKIVQAAAKNLGIKPAEVQKRISGYAQANFAECVAEAFADVYCNGSNARQESRTVVSVLDTYFNH